MSSETSVASHPFAPLTFPAVSTTPGLIEEQARTRGHASGYASGMRAAEQTLRAQHAAAVAEHAALMETSRRDAAALNALLAAAVDALNARVVPVLEETQHAIAEASIDLAEAIIGVELADHETSARAAVTRALRDVDPVTVLALRVHPDMLVGADLDLPAGLSVRADATLDRGDAIVDFADGYLDARISSAVARAREALLDGAASSTGATLANDTALTGGAG